MEEGSPGHGLFADGEYTMPMSISPTPSAPSTPMRNQSIFLPINGSLDGPITHLFSVTTLPKTVTIDEFLTLRELESQGVILRGVGLLKYRGFSCNYGFTLGAWGWKKQGGLSYMKINVDVYLDHTASDGGMVSSVPV
ncbi:hypothetical protein Clacol_002075 [Clathrus columnatus]|nr:hypothetical protein Clacol_002075 [Clathrus columnatus]